jgi:hypothetical protein
MAAFEGGTELTDDKYEEEFADRVKHLASDYNAPSDVPRDAMWARINARREDERVESNVLPLPVWQRRPVWITTAIAALLVITFTVGRISAPDSTTPITAVQQMAANDTTTDIAPSELIAGEDDPRDKRFDLYRMAAAPVFGDAEVLLTQFRNNGQGSEDGKEYADRAAALLSDTRLLIDSPASEDAELKYLLTDLELILAQIVRVARSREDKEWAQESMKNRAILERLKVEVAANRFM